MANSDYVNSQQKKERERERERDSPPEIIKTHVMFFSSIKKQTHFKKTEIETKIKQITLKI